MGRIILLSDIHISPTHGFFWENWCIARDFANRAAADAVIVNGTMPRRFSRQDLERIALATREGGDGAEANVASNAVQMARTVNDRARVQLAQIARLRRQRFAGGSPPAVLTVPFAFVPVFDLDAVRRISERLASRI